MRKKGIVLRLPVIFSMFPITTTATDSFTYILKNWNRNTQELPSQYLLHTNRSAAAPIYMCRGDQGRLPSLAMANKGSSVSMHNLLLLWCPKRGISLKNEPGRSIYTQTQPWEVYTACVYSAYLLVRRQRRHKGFCPLLKFVISPLAQCFQLILLPRLAPLVATSNRSHRQYRLQTSRLGRPIWISLRREN